HRARARRAQRAQGPSSADAVALAELRDMKDRIGERLNDASLPAHVCARLLAEFRQTVLSILAIERQQPPAAEKEMSIVEELRARRAERLNAGRAAAGLPPLEQSPQTASFPADPNRC